MPPFAPQTRHWLLVAVLASCATQAPLPASSGYGPAPSLPAPREALIPLVHIAPAVGWSAGQKPTAAPGLEVEAFATGLEHPRWLHVLPNGDVLVAESAAPPQPEDAKGIKGWAMKRVMKAAGALPPSANRITLLRDENGDGVPETRSVFLGGLHSPFGMALIGHDFYVANTDALMRFSYFEGQTRISSPGTKVVDLPAGRINHHWTKNVIAAEDGSKLFVTVGSNSNVAENGIDVEEGRAAIWEVAPDGTHRLFATGLRNPNGMAWEPSRQTLWTVVNERDEIGNELVPDYLTSVEEGGFYGWPYSYFGSHLDSRVSPPRPDLVARAKVPDYAVGAHTAALGLAWSGGTRLPAPFTEGMFIGQHGSWNRSPASGYKVIFVPFRQGRPFGAPLEVLSGFLDSQGRALGRPVAVAIDRQGALLVADDVGNCIWRVTAQGGSSVTR